jgi:hypothetical protein
MKPATFMSMVRWKLVNSLECEHTYGYITKSNRIQYGIDKSHANDAFVIAGGAMQIKAEPFIVQQVRRNNRSLEKFYDAQYMDFRTGEKTSGKELFNGRTTRNKNKNGENLRKYRQQKLKKGRRSIRKNRYPYQPKDLVWCNNKKAFVVSTQNEDQYVKLKDVKKVQKLENLVLIKSGKGICFM